MLGETTSTGVTYTTPSEQRDFNSLVEKYMLLDKKTLAELLALKEWQEQAQPQFPSYPSYPTYPAPPQGPWVTYCQHCTNPFHDCINCPYHTTGGWPVEVTTNIKYTTNTTADIQ